jgi:DHA2 family multidrug resistance protein
MAAAGSVDTGENTSVQIEGPKLAFAIVLLSLVNFMSLLDTTVVNVSVPHIAGSLAVAPNEGVWTITSYSVAEAIMLPLTGWLAQRFGVVRMLTSSTIGFGLCSALCGTSTSLGMLVVGRVLQGVCGGPLIAIAQALLMRVTPKRHVNMAMGLSMMTVVVAPVMGPILGGLITDGIGWPWVFYINVPVSALAAFLGWRMFASRETTRVRTPIDYFGFILLVVWVGALQIMLDTGQNEDWFSSSFIVALAIIAGLGFVIFLIWELTDAHPIVNLNIYRYRSFALTSLGTATAFGCTFGSIVLVPLWLQTNMGYTASNAGEVIAFNSSLAMFASPATAYLMSRVDPRALMSFGLFLLAGSTLYRVTFAQNMDFWSLVPPHVVNGVGSALFFIPIISVALTSVPPSDAATAAGLLNFLRTMSGAFAAAIVTSVWYDEARRVRAATVGQINRPAAVLSQLGGAHHMPSALSKLDAMVQSQSVMVATNHLFLYLGLILVCVALSVWLLPKPKGAAPAGAGH